MNAFVQSSVNCAWFSAAKNTFKVSNICCFTESVKVSFPTGIPERWPLIQPFLNSAHFQGGGYWPGSNLTLTYDLA